MNKSLNKKLLLGALCFLIVFILTACGQSPTSIAPEVVVPSNVPPAVNTPVPTATSTPEPTITPTPGPQGTLAEPADIFEGPRNDGSYSLLKSLPMGEKVNVFGLFGDFVKVESQGITGYIGKKVFSTLPQIENIDIKDIPWQPVYKSGCQVSNTVDEGSALKYSLLPSENSSDMVIALLQTDKTYRIHFQIQSPGDGGWRQIKIQGKLHNGNWDGDPWWKGNRRMDIGIDGDYYVLKIFGGTSSDYAATIPLHVKSSEAITIQTLDTTGRTFDILNEDNQVVDQIDLTKISGVNLPDGLYPDGEFFVGTNLGFPGSMKLTTFEITTPPDGIWDDLAVSGLGLRSYSEKNGITTGTEFSMSKAGNPLYCSAIQRDFDVAVISSFSDPAIWIGPGEYDFSQLDQIVDLALLRGHKVYASHLVWGEVSTLPKWLTEGNFTQDQYSQFLEDYIKAVVGAYKDKVSEWSIANEAANRDPYPGLDFWYDKIGPEYIEKSFQWAREADPDGILIFNADNNESSRDTVTNGNIQRMYDTVKDLKTKGVSIDVVGMQMHLFLPWNSKVLPKKDDVILTMKKFADLGVSIYITEMDVNLHGRKGTTDKKLQFQADVYGEMVSACVDSGVCKRFTTWGINDGDSWIDLGADAAPLLFDDNYHPKPAYTRVREVLAGQ